MMSAAYTFEEHLNNGTHETFPNVRTKFRGIHSINADTDGIVRKTSLIGATSNQWIEGIMPIINTDRQRI
jgi:hypothetical protein